MQIISKTKRFVKDFIEIVVISIFGILGLIFIFMVPFDPPEERDKSLWQRVKDAVHEVSKSMSSVVCKER